MFSFLDSAKCQVLALLPKIEQTLFKRTVIKFQSLVVLLIELYYHNA